MTPLTVLLRIVLAIPTQQDPFVEPIIVKTTRLEVREALRLLFNPIQFPYSVNPDVQGEITLNLHGVSLGEAFSKILYQANADYRSGGGIIQIFRKEDRGEISTFHLPSFNVRDHDLVWVFGKTFEYLGVRGILYPEARGKVSYIGNPSSVPQLLDSLTAKSSNVYRVTRQGYEVLKAPPTAPLFKFVSNLPYSQPQALVDGNLKFVVERDQLSKVSRPGQATLGTVLLHPILTISVLDLNSDADRRKLQELANLADCKLAIAPEIRCVVTIEPGPATVEHLKMCLAKSLNVPLEAGLILAPLNRHTFLNVFDFQPLGEHTFTRSELRRAGEVLQVDAGRWRHLIRLRDLVIVKTEPRPLKRSS